MVLDVGLTYRLLRALASLGFLKEESLDRFSLSSQGELLRKRSSTDITRHNTAGGRARALSNMETFTFNGYRWSARCFCSRIWSQRV
ncbi:MAG: hypothetical protein H0W19_06775 [Nitrosopumilus sp.]|nr:hypothetical protein [Nitrosopumilus sp.]